MTWFYLKINPQLKWNFSPVLLFSMDFSSLYPYQIQSKPCERLNLWIFIEEMFIFLLKCNLPFVSIHIPIKLSTEKHDKIIFLYRKNRSLSMNIVTSEREKVTKLIVKSIKRRYAMTIFCRKKKRWFFLLNVRSKKKRKKFGDKKKVDRVFRKGSCTLWEFQSR